MGLDGQIMVDGAGNMDEYKTSTCIRRKLIATGGSNRLKDDMEFLKCKACGSYGMVPMDVTLFEDGSEDGDSLEIRGRLTDKLADGPEDEAHEPIEPDSEESRFYSCHVCGDNWLSIRKLDTEGDARVTFIHQMGVQPVLRRVAHVEPQIAPNEDSVRRWEYFLDETEVEEGEWLGRLADRRKVLKAICSN